MNPRIALPAALLVLSCSGPSDPTRPDANGRVLGAVEFYGDSIRISAPATAQVDAEVRVSVITYGGGCIRLGDTDAHVSGLTALVTPYDYDSTASLPPKSACTMELALLEHVATLKFGRPGQATLTVRGQSKPSGGVVSASRVIEVR